MNNISRERLNLVYPGLAQRIMQMAEMLPFDMEVTQGLRTYAEQDAIYNQVPRVTNAQGGYSWHNFGLAVDVAPFDSGQPVWEINHPYWPKLVAVGESLGLVSGSRWTSFPDWPHFQLTGRFPESPTDEVRTIYLERGSIYDVWDAAFSASTNQKNVETL